VNLQDEFARILFAARASGPAELRDRWSQGYMPKKPSPVETTIAGFISSLSEAQKELLLVTVVYFIDASLFKLLVSLENGVGSKDFALTIRDKATKEQQELIGPDVDHDLKHEFFRWRETLGQSV